jgi:hypothetical protein
MAPAPEKEMAAERPNIALCLGAQLDLTLRRSSGASDLLTGVAERS